MFFQLFFTLETLLTALNLTDERPTLHLARLYWIRCSHCGGFGCRRGGSGGSGGDHAAALLCAVRSRSGGRSRNCRRHWRCPLWRCGLELVLVDVEELLPLLELGQPALLPKVEPHDGLGTDGGREEGGQKPNVRRFGHLLQWVVAVG